jgi:cytochrome b561
MRLTTHFRRSSPSNVEAKNEWSYTSTFLYAIMLCTGVLVNPLSGILIEKPLKTR